MGRPIFQEYCIESRVRATRYSGNNIYIQGLVAVNGNDIWCITAENHEAAAQGAKQEAKLCANRLNADPPRHKDAVEYRNGAEFALRSWQ